MEPISLWSSLARAMTSSGNASLASSARAGHSINAATYSIPVQCKGSTETKKKTRKIKSGHLSEYRSCKTQRKGTAHHHQAPRKTNEYVPLQSPGPFTYLAIEGDWRLIEPGLLRIPDVRRDDLVEWQVMGDVRLELYAVFLGFDGQLTAHSILDIEDRRIQRIDCESAHIATAAERAEDKKIDDATRH